MERQLGEVLREYRSKAGLSVKEISELLIQNGFKASEKTVYSWENNNSRPNPDAFLFLCEKYKINNVLDTFGYATETLREDKVLPTQSELDFIKKYQLISDHGREVIDAILNIEYKYYEQAKAAQERKLAEEKAKQQAAISKKAETQKAAYQAAAIRRLPNNVVLLEDYDEEPENMITLPLYDTGASAGTGVFLDSTDYEMIAIEDDYTTRRANFAVWVSGNSMEPRFSDGDLVLVRTQPTVDIGDIGIFVLNDEGYIKKLGVNKLVSLNPAYDDIEFGEDDEIYCKGKVLAKA